MTQKLLSPSLTLSLTLLLLSGSAALASPPPIPQQQLTPGMRHMQVAPATPPLSPQQQAQLPQSAPQPGAPAPGQEPTGPAPKKVLTPEEAVLKEDQLKTWSHLPDVVVMTKRGTTESLIQTIETEPGVVPPQALFFLAKGLAEQKKMEDAAVYYYVGQLRLSFDVARWPPRLDAEQVARILAEKKKTQDQAAALPPPKLKNPHEGVALLAAAIGGPITQWMLEEPSRADRVMARVKLWDETTPYAYLPGYDVPPALPHEEWVKLLPSIRAGYYARMNEFISGLKKVKGQ